MQLIPSSAPQYFNPGFPVIIASLRLQLDVLVSAPDLRYVIAVHLRKLIMRLSLPRPVPHFS